MMTRSGLQRCYDHRLRDLVQRTGDLTIATDLGVPRSTERGWLGSVTVYSWRWLTYHLWHANRGDEVRALLLRPAWLEAKARAVGAHALLEDFELVRGDRDLEVVEATWRLALPALVHDPDQLAEQFLGRLPPVLTEGLSAFRSELVRAAAGSRLHARWPNLHGPGSGLVQTLIGHREGVDGVLLAEDDRALSWGEDGTFRVWDLTTGEGRVLAGHEARVTGALRLPDGRTLSWSNDGTLRVWDLTTEEGRTLTGHENAVTGALVLPEGAVLSWSKDKTLRVWDLTTGESQALTGHEDEVKGVLALANGGVLSWSDDRTWRVWDLATGASRVFPSYGRIDRAMLLADGRPVSSMSFGLQVWDLETGASHCLNAHEELIEGVLELPDGRVLSCS